MINCIILDDEPLALDLLEDFIRKIPFLNLSAKFNQPLKALDFINNNEADLIFIDVKMPDISGIDFFKSLSKKPELIFTTAYSEYALQGFELKALDYLLKPISFERFVTAANRAKDYIESRKGKPGNGKDYFFINVSHKIHKVFYNDILYLEGFKDYTKIFLANVAAPLVILHNLKYFEDFLQEADFVRIHRSYIVPVNKLNTITRKTVTIGSKLLPVSDNYREKLFAVIAS